MEKVTIPEKFKEANVKKIMIVILEFAKPFEISKGIEKHSLC